VRPRDVESSAMAKLTGAALAAHELGLAATFGGILFGQTGLESTARVVSDPRERSLVMNKGWSVFAIPKAIGLTATALTWLVGRSLFSGRWMSRDMRRLVVAKDIALALTVAAGAGTGVCGQLLSREAPFPVANDGQPAADAPERVKTLVRTVSTLGTVQMIAAGAALALTSALNLRGQKNFGWNAIARVLP
jgi:hypothetical protein